MSICNYLLPLFMHNLFHFLDLEKASKGKITIVEKYPCKGRLVCPHEL